MKLRKATSNLLIFDPEFTGFANKFISSMGSDSEIVPVKSLAELTHAIDSFSNVRFLEVALHGSPGQIRFANGAGMTGVYFAKLAFSKPFIAKNARILFDSCNIGEGTAGDDFMDEFGKLMFFGKGGILGATTVANHVYFPNTIFATNVYMNPREGLDAKLKVRRYDNFGNSVAQTEVNRLGF
ncbi:MAG: hypothetical protein ACK5NT_12475 [Pyrinomonadaceae bacterium]